MTLPILPLQSALRALANPEKAKTVSSFFKTGKGEYGEGDVFLGVTVPETRKTVREFYPASDFSTAEVLLASEFHEERLA